MLKTPVATLEELGLKLKTKPVYEWTNLETPMTQIYFSCAVKFMRWEATEYGNSKKLAKQNAAKTILDMISANKSNSFPVEPGLPKADDESSSLNDRVLNTIGQLQTFCARHSLAPPDYVVTEDIGPSRIKVYSVECFAAGMKEEAIATSKKLAKRNAAAKIMNRLKVSYPNHDFSSDGDSETDSEASDKSNVTRNCKNIMDVETKESNVYNDPRQIVLQELQELLHSINNSSAEIGQITVIEQRLIKIISRIDVKCTTLLGSFEDNHILTIYITTVPPIVVADAGKDMVKMAMNIYYKAVKSLIQTLSAKV